MESLPRDILYLLSDTMSLTDSARMLCVSKAMYAILSVHHQERIAKRKQEIFNPILCANTDPLWISTIQQLIAEAHLTSQQWYTGLKTKNNEWIFVRGNKQYVSLLTLLRFPFVYLCKDTKQAAIELLESVTVHTTLYTEILNRGYLEPVCGIRTYTE